MVGRNPKMVHRRQKNWRPNDGHEQNEVDQGVANPFSLYLSFSFPLFLFFTPSLLFSLSFLFSSLDSPPPDVVYESVVEEGMSICSASNLWFLFNLINPLIRRAFFFTFILVPFLFFFSFSFTHHFSNTFVISNLSGPLSSNRNYAWSYENRKRKIIIIIVRVTPNISGITISRFDRVEFCKFSLNASLRDRVGRDVGSENAAECDTRMRSRCH